MKKLLILVLLLATVITWFTGCGSSTPEPTPVVVTFNSNVDGNVNSNGLINYDGFTMGVGDNAENFLMQALVSFPFTLPAGAQIKTATLRLYCSDFQGSPFPSDILVEHLQVDFGDIDQNDYAVNPNGLTPCGKFTSLIMDGWNELNVTSSVQQDYAASRNKSQFRLYRTTPSDNDSIFDSNSFYTLDIPPEYGQKKPELVITYTL